MAPRRVSTTRFCGSRIVQPSPLSSLFPWKFSAPKASIPRSHVLVNFNVAKNSRFRKSLKFSPFANRANRWNSVPSKDERPSS